ncbi:MAG TPA: helix-turn-helix transcriptional regulator, partial [Chitinophagaceae bacterium]|nr:helix-turn-helix transcriptional regulator [Chitinophagaceae bacterium]
KKLAEKIGVKPQNISKILKGDVNLTLKTIATLATELNTELISFPFYSDEEYTVFMKLTKPDNYLGIKANHSIFKPISFNAEGYNFSEMAKLNLNE